MASSLLLSRLLLDALDEFEAAIAHLPAPGRGGPLGPLSASPWVVGHVAAIQDRWLTQSRAPGAPDAWCAAWRERHSTDVPYGTLATPLAEAIEAFEQVRERARAFAPSLDAETLRTPANLAGSSWESSGATTGYLVARSVAHAFVHAGDLTVIAALAGAGDLGLPGPLTRTTEGIDTDDASASMVAALLRDGYVELRRTFAALPLPALTGEIVSLNPGSYTALHTLAREDRFWNVLAQRRDADPFVGSFDFRAPPAPVPPSEVLDAMGRTLATADAWLASLDAAALGAAIEAGRTRGPIGVQVARSAAHVFSHAGELQSVGSLAGAPDLGLPGALAHTMAATR
ncbi:MAG: hypothetical protein AMXMBFR23_20210 [Chloroflexota bacterium]